MSKSEIAREYGLPPVPEEGTGDRNLYVFRFQAENLLLAENVSLTAAQEYTSRDDTHGNGWFTGFDLS